MHPAGPLASDPPLNRWFNVGHSDATDPVTAGAQAAVAALAGRTASVLFVFSSLNEHLASVAEGVRRNTEPGTIIVGGSSFGEITPVGPGINSVVAVALGGDGITARAAISKDAAGREREAGAELAVALGRTGRPYEVLMLFPDGILRRQHEIVRGAYSIVGATVPMAGGCSADQRYFKTYQLYGDHSGIEVASGSVVAVVLGSDGPIGIGCAHGWHRRGEPMTLTSSDDTRIIEFDHKPALDVYLERAGAEPSIVEDEAAMSRLSIKYPLGLARRSGEDIRVIQSFDAVARTMSCYADVQQGALVWMMEADQDDLIGGGRQSCLQATANLAGAAPIGVMQFDCGARRIALGPDGVDQEVAKMIEAVGAAPIAGYYSMGEIFRTRGARGMHHLTSVALAFG